MKREFENKQKITSCDVFLFFDSATTVLLEEESVSIRLEEYKQSLLEFKT